MVLLDDCSASLLFSKWHIINTPVEEKTDFMENTAVGRAKSNQACPEKTAQLVGFWSHVTCKCFLIHSWKARLTGCGSMPSFPSLPQKISAMWHSQSGWYDPLIRWVPTRLQWPPLNSAKNTCRKTHKRHISCATGEVTGGGHLRRVKKLVTVRISVTSFWQLVLWIP